MIDKNKKYLSNSQFSKLIKFTSSVWSEIYNIRITLINSLFPDRYLRILYRRQFGENTRESLFQKVKRLFSSKKVHSLTPNKKSYPILTFTEFFIKREKPKYENKLDCFSPDLLFFDECFPVIIRRIDTYYLEEVNIQNESFLHFSTSINNTKIVNMYKNDSRSVISLINSCNDITIEENKSMK